MSAPRRFNLRQRLALWLAAGGQCAACGAAPVLAEADHVYPWSKGGATDVVNGQWLCRQCNQHKGARVNHDQLRGWQTAALGAWRSHTSENFLLVATPGSGKTRAALAMAAYERTRGITRVIVVVPTDHLRTQWCEAATACGVGEMQSWANGTYRVPKDLWGLVVTYQQVEWNPDLHRKLTSECPTLVILDEIHHAGREASWGKAVAYAYAPAAARLLLSGTPWRLDGTPIPFVRYDTAGQCVMDYHYPYRQALTDGFCRSLLFQTFEGHLEWMDERGETQAASFADTLSERDARRRLASALDTRVPWLRQLLFDAHAQLQQLRRDENPSAGGLIVAVDTQHADAIAALMEEITGARVAVAHSNLDWSDPTKVISTFRSSTAPWLVAVNMVSEGVDIPRLRVGVYATRITSAIFFAQVCGRFVRHRPESEEGWAKIYLPKDPDLVRLATAVEQDVQDYHTRLITPRGPQGTDANEIDHAAYWQPTHAVAFSDDLIAHGETYRAEELRAARAILAECPDLRLSDAQAVRFLRKVLATAAATPPQSPPLATPDPIPAADPRRALRTAVKHCVNQVAAATGRSQRDINAELRRRQGVYVQECSLAQLQERLAWLTQWSTIASAAT